MRHKGSIIGEGWRYLQVWLDFPVRDTLSDALSSGHKQLECKSGLIEPVLNFNQLLLLTGHFPQCLLIAQFIPS